ncbi:MAG: PD40 domain-containing protein [Planctomycetes bacterium]|nr:PD40 domain-containing protein [Planctomycetota bacterium]
MATAHRGVLAISLLAWLATAALGQSLVQLTSNSTQSDFHPSISADGQTVAWSEFDTATRAADHLVARAPGFVPVRLGGLPRGHQEATFRLSGDGTTIAFYQGGSIFVRSTSGGAPRQITSSARLVMPNYLSLSDDGRFVGYLVYDWPNGNYDVEVLETTTQTVTTIVTASASWGWASFGIAGDGNTLVLTDGQPLWEIWQFGISGGRLRRLASMAPLAVFFPTFDRRGTRCAFEAGATAAGFSLHAVTTAGTLATLAAPVGRRRAPIVSGNGDRVLWGDGDLWWAYADGGAARNVTGLNAAASGLSLGSAVSEDGSLAVLSSRLDPLGTNPEGDFELFLWRDALSSPGPAWPGTTVSFRIDVPKAPGASYIARVAFGRTGGPVLPGVGPVPLSPDALFFASGTPGSIFRNMSGTLDGQGLGTFHVDLPAAPALSGMAFFGGAVVVGPAVTITPAVKIVVR